VEYGFKAFAETVTLMPKKPLSGSFFVVVIGLSLTFCRGIFFIVYRAPGRIEPIIDKFY